MFWVPLGGGSCKFLNYWIFTSEYKSNNETNSSISEQCQEKKASWQEQSHLWSVCCALVLHWHSSDSWCNLFLKLWNILNIQRGIANIMLSCESTAWHSDSNILPYWQWFERNKTFFLFPSLFYPHPLLWFPCTFYTFPVSHSQYIHIYICMFKTFL